MAALFRKLAEVSKSLKGNTYLDHISYCESLDCLVLGSASRAVGASDRLDVTTSLLVTSAGEVELALESLRLRDLESMTALSFIVRGSETSNSG